ncbi:YfhO family protein [Myxococcota bacterium]|nr:YfhO family protein [Myxococcota bacterium]
MRASKLGHTAAVLALLALVAITFREILGESRGLAFRDHLAVFRPWFWNLVEAIRSGELPALTRASPAGVPIEALFIPAYTPSTLLLFAGPFEQSYDLFVVSLYAILACGAYALAIELGAKVRDAIVVGAVAALAGPVLSFENLLGATVGMAWAPWVFWSLVRTLRTPRPAPAAALAITTGFHLQGIMPELVIADVAALAVLLSVVRPRITVALASALVLAAVLALGIASIRVMPVYEALQGSERMSGFAYTLASQRALSVQSLIELFVPAFWTPQEVPFLSEPVDTSVIARAKEAQASYLTSLYLGAALVPGLVGLFRVEDRVTRALLVGLAVLFFLLALGPLTPVHRWWFSIVPGMSTVRFPVKWMVPFAALVTAGLPHGLAALAARPKLLVALVALQLAIVAGALSTAQLPELADYARCISAHVDPSFAGITREDIGAVFVATLTPRLHYALAVLVVAFVLVVVAVVRPAARELALGGYAALIALDLALAGAFTIEGVDVRLTPPQDVLSTIESDEHRVYAVLPSMKEVPIAPDPATSLYERRMISNLHRGQWRFQHVRQYEDMNRDATSNPASALRFQVVQKLRGAEARRALARAGVAWALSHRVDDTPNAWSFEVPGEPPHWVLPIAGVRDYLTAYSKWVVTDPDRWTREDLRKYYLSEESTEIAVVRGGVRSSTITPEGCAPKISRIPTEAETRIAASVESACPTIVVALETRVPGWHGTIDGVESEVLDAELGFLGAAVPAGRHEVVFEYRSRTARWVPVSITCLVVALATLAAGVARRRRGAPTAARGEHQGR